jgi:hypothetical protein
MPEERKNQTNQVLSAVLIFLAAAILVIIVLVLLGPTIGNVYSSIGTNL